MNEREFLKNYDPKEFDVTLVTVDSVLFTCHENELKVLMVERPNFPERSKWGLPGGFIDFKKDKSLEDAAKRKLKEKTSVEPPYIEQLVSVGGAKRDPRGWSVSVCFTALIAYQECEVHIDTVSDAKWFGLGNLDELKIAFDHRMIIDHALDRLKQKALYSIVPAYALPDKFTLPELQHVHEIILGKEIQKKSFRRRIESADILEETGGKRASGKRQAMLYRMKENSKAFTFGTNLER
ncbi:NUDIX hydrolase [Oleiphilus sp. HI0071]|uniref:NUDIX hydrolase n=1 Tax=Oleiphilus sp. HI0080 TaxID=1822255 RepID=UPI0007C29A4F|nr:NUDIX domain-containing protein [Oleiphilus sp. HI0080]KZY60165.1 NUDIX hydrolase [Oleiphilus sp. HI0065]KZY83480.1 NUDIX hydrolase [Oleiphilus sp. HI0071]KZY90134.1 NUDIX hydrolase [Oleiphilus sp. HI0073]KZZ49651.1 NUDIX hydrolase [Oleiphilus sp. HI0122]KZZ18711.1 NUDIX hydrolase [Oleiphilus sp. HI0080]